jgi:hypothetical protein
VFAVRSFATASAVADLADAPVEEVVPSEDTLCINGRYDEEGTIVIHLNDEDIWCPDVARSIEWCLSSPTDIHLFNETPVIKETTDETPHEDEMNLPEGTEAEVRAALKKSQIA